MMDRGIVDNKGAFLPATDDQMKYWPQLYCNHCRRVFYSHAIRRKVEGKWLNLCQDCTQKVDESRKKQ